MRRKMSIGDSTRQKANIPEGPENIYKSCMKYFWRESKHAGKQRGNLKPEWWPQWIPEYLDTWRLGFKAHVDMKPHFEWDKVLEIRPKRKKQNVPTCTEDPGESSLSLFRQPVGKSHIIPWEIRTPCLILIQAWREFFIIFRETPFQNINRKFGYETEMPLVLCP